MKRIDFVFVLALITLFAATSLSLVFIGAKQYRNVTNQMNENFDKRTTSSYLAEKIHQNDQLDCITITKIDSVTALCISETAENTTLTTYIYCYDGYLRELVVTDTSVFSLDSGEKLLAMKDFTAVIYNDSLIRIDTTLSDGTTQIFYYTIRSGIGKEAA